MSELKMFKGDTIFIKGKKRKETVAVALIDNGLDDAKIRMNKVIRKNLRVRLGDVVQIRPANDVPNLTKIHILPFQDTI
jgi:transitional endoplasmic reticulum ATPase